METYDRDDPPEVGVCTVSMQMVDGELKCIPQAHDWLSLMSDDLVAAVLYDCADAMLVLAESFGPRPDDDGAAVVKLVKPDATDPGDGTAA